MTEMTQKQTEQLSHEYSKTPKPERLYKDRIFRMIFSGNKELLNLYNAVNGTNYKNPDDLEVNTLEHVIYMGMRNDISFVIDSRLSLYEHQSTYNPNLPLRDLFYTANLFSKITGDKNLYGSKLIKLPTPKFIVFYNGIETQPERKELLLSDAYEMMEPEVSLELKVLMLNINSGYNEELKENCKTLRDYMGYVNKVREFAKAMPLEAAVELAINECISDDILAEFLRNNRLEVKSVSIYEYDEELHMRQEREASKEEGRAEGRTEGRTELLHLINQMVGDGLSEQIPKLSTDSTYLEVMYEKYKIGS